MSKDADGRARAATEFNKLIQQGIAYHLLSLTLYGSLTLPTRTDKEEERKASGQDIRAEAARWKAQCGRAAVVG